MSPRSARLFALLLAAALLPQPRAELAAQAAPAAPPTADEPAELPAPVVSTEFTLQVPPGKLQLGQRFELLVHGAVKSGDVLVLEEPPPGLELGSSRLEQTSGGLVLHQPLRVTREGEIKLAGLTIVSGDERKLLPVVVLDVALDLPVGHVPQVAEALPPVTLPGLPPWLAIGGAALGLALLLAGWWWWRRRPAAAVVAEPPRPADVVAAEALAALRGRLPRTAEDVPPFVTAVSDVLRVYIEQRFGVHAPESTTEEFLAVAASRHDALASRREVLAGFLTRCDLVKFARYRPEPGFALPLLELAERFVAETRPQPEATAAVLSEVAA